MAQSDVDKLVSQEYKLGFTVDVEEDTVAVENDDFQGAHRHNPFIPGGPPP